jgi:hypothetical protein
MRHSVVRFALAALLALFLPVAAVAANNARTSAQPVNSATANASLIADLFQNESVIAFNVTGLTASGATLTIEGSSDGRNDADPAKAWFAINGNALPGGSTTGFTTVTSDQAFRVDVAGLTNVRIRVSTTGTGTILAGFNAIPGASLGSGGGPFSTVITPSGAASSGIVPIVAGPSANSAVLKAAPGNFYGLTVTPTSAVYVFLINATSLPANATLTPGIASGNLQECLGVVPANLTSTFTFDSGPTEVFSTGITVALSSTACPVLTASAVGTINGRAN